MSLLEQIVAIIAPHHCLGCGFEGVVLCKGCAGGLVPISSRCYRCGRLTADFRTCRSCRASSALFSVRAATAYDGLAKDVIHMLKFVRAGAAADDIAAVLARRFLFEGPTVITHVPTAATRIRQRGYDQAALIARSLSQATGIPYSSLLIRQNSARQVGRTREQRRQQVAEAFKTTNRRLNTHVLLVDDVLTTGATCEAAARLLRQSGAHRVSAVVFAAA